MIPTFPEFKKIAWQDLADVRQFILGFPYYSDYNFVSMWAWNTREKMMLSQLHGNLILLFYDYLTETPFLSFIGRTDLADTAHRLIDYSESRYQTASLRLIPDEVAKHLSDIEFSVNPDADSHDYILSVSHLSSLDRISGSQSLAAFLCKKFFRLYPHCTARRCLIQDCEKEQCVELFKNWAKAKSLNHQELNEYSAFERYIRNAETGSRIVSLYDGKRLIGFISYELLSSDFAICHFAKADTSYKGIYDALIFELGKALLEKGIRYLNFEQDLGIPVLRQSKLKLNPVSFLKKYVIEKKNSLRLNSIAS